MTGSYEATASGGNNNCDAYETTKSQWGGSTNTTMYAFNGANYYKPAYYGSPTSTNITLDVSGGKLTGLPSGLSGGTLLVTRGI